MASGVALKMFRAISFSSTRMATWQHLFQMALLNGWDFQLLTNYDYFRATASHDGFIHLITEDDRLAEEAKTSLDRAKIGYRLRPR